MITLTKKQTLLLFWKSIRNKDKKRKFKFTSKSQWKCLNCGEPIFVPYLNENANSIYCKKYEQCRGLRSRCLLHPNLVEINYYKLLKEEQFNIINTK